MDGIDDIEAAALRLVRGARHTCEQLGTLGYRFVGLTDWLEATIPRVNRIISDAARAASHELTRPRPPRADRPGEE